MRITARIPGGNGRLLQYLQAFRISGQVVQNFIVVDLQELPEKSGFPSPRAYYLPPQLSSLKPEPELHIELSEHGGAELHSGSATIVCGVSGKALRPFRIPRSNVMACGEHAIFSVPWAVMAITATHPGDKIEVLKHRIEKFPMGARLKTEEVWKGCARIAEVRCRGCGFEGPPEKHARLQQNRVCSGTLAPTRLDLPAGLEKYQAAAAAAAIKSKCLHCREPHYFLRT
ncbi:MAG: hypothetical protein M1153_02190 [Patescibacteria group bacterium]|nr:hypothetical protein [Patescibacteria group bacterium]